MASSLSLSRRSHGAPAGIFTKGIADDVWVILFWRGLFSAVFIAVYVVARRRVQTISDFAGLGVAGWAAATVGAFATVCYLSAFKHTSVTNVVVIYATTPFIAAGLVWLTACEPTDRLTLLASALALAGVVVMMGGSLGTPNLLGDGLALAMAVLMAAMMVLIRAYPSAPMVPAMCVSSLQIVVVALAVSDPLAVSANVLSWLTAFGLVQAAAVILLTEGTRRIPASHAALIGTIDIPLAPLWAWLLLGEAPAPWSVVGGVIVTSAVLVHMGRNWKAA